ncbi:hypothetical protein ACQ4PT_068708 [Festuca glaucescens]
MTKWFPRLQLPDGATGRPAVIGVQHRQQAGVADNPMNMNGPNPIPATNSRSRGATSGADHAENVAGPSVTVVEPKKSRAFLSILYLDSLDVDEPVPSIEECPIRAAAWLGTFIEQVGDLEQAEDSAKGVCGRVRKRQRPEPFVVVDEDIDDDADDEDYNADGDEDDEDNEDSDDEDDEDDKDGDNEDGASKEHPSNGQHNEDDDFEDRGAHFENTPRRSARLGNMNTNQTVGAENTPVRGLSPFSDIRGFASSGGEDIDMTNNQAPQFFDITKKIYPNSIFMEEIARSQRVSPAATPPLDQFRRDTETNRVAQKSSGPTRETCPPPRPKDPRWEKGCDPPSFNLGFDSPPKNQEQSTVVAASAGITPTSLRSIGSPIFDEYEDVWSPEMEEEAIALCTKVEMEKGYRKAEADTMGVGHQSEAELQTPTPVANRVTHSKDASGSNSDAAPIELCERRIIRPAACYKSPYIDFSSKNTYACSADVTEVYDLVTSGAKRNERDQHKDNTPIIVNFEKFFVSHQEMANSMMPCAELDNTVFELGLESIMLRKDKDDKKVVMPLRFMTLLQEYGWKHKDVKKYFAKKDALLDKKDLVLLPVLENMSEDPTVKVNHYLLLVLNIKDRRFEVLDSMRTINDKKLALLVKNLQAAITSLWNEHYPKSRIKLEKFDLSDIFAPKQKTNKDCGVHALMNAEHWT